jgi:FkbM family methyltransferase
VSDFRARALSGLHRTLVGQLPDVFQIHGGRVSFSSGGSHMSIQAYYVGEIEYHQMRYLLSLLVEGAVFLDVGGHHGAFAAIVGSELKARKLGGMVYTFEPDPRNLSYLARNLKQNELEDEVRIVPKAVAGESGSSKFAVSSDNSCNWLIEVDPGPDVALRDTETTCIDDFCEGFDRVDIIKIDIQGGELSALKGAERTIERFSPVLFVEVMEYVPGAGDETRFFLEKIGYKVHYLSKGGQLVDPGSSEIFVSWDVVAVPNRV